LQKQKEIKELILKDEIKKKPLNKNKVKKLLLYNKIYKN
jgi:hypothetical protein